MKPALCNTISMRRDVSKKLWKCACTHIDTNTHWPLSAYVHTYTWYTWTNTHKFMQRERAKERNREGRESVRACERACVCVCVRERESVREREGERERICFKITIHSSWSWLLLTRFKAFHVCKSIRKLSNRKQSSLNFLIFLNTLNLLLHVTLLSYMIPAWAASGSLRSDYVNWFVT